MRSRRKKGERRAMGDRRAGAELRLYVQVFRRSKALSDLDADADPSESSLSLRTILHRSLTKRRRAKLTGRLWRILALRAVWSR